MKLVKPEKYNSRCMFFFVIIFIRANVPHTFFLDLDSVSLSLREPQKVEAIWPFSHKCIWLKALLWFCSPCLTNTFKEQPFFPPFAEIKINGHDGHYPVACLVTCSSLGRTARENKYFFFLPGVRGCEVHTSRSSDFTSCHINDSKHSI